MEQEHDVIVKMALEEHYEALFRYFRKYLNACDAEDAVQETAWLAMNGAESYDRNRPIDRWLVGIARHELSKRLKQITENANLVVGPIQEDRDGTTQDDPAQDRFLGDLAVQQLVLDAKLNSTEREVLRLTLAGLKPIDIASQIGTTPNAVSVTKDRIKKKLRPFVQTDDDE